MVYGIYDLQDTCKFKSRREKEYITYLKIYISKYLHLLIIIPNCIFFFFVFKFSVFTNVNLQYILYSKTYFPFKQK